MRVFQAVIAVTTELDLPCPLLAGAGQRSAKSAPCVSCSRGLGFEKREQPDSAQCRLPQQPGRAAARTQQAAAGREGRR